MQGRHIPETQGNHLCSVDNGYMTCKQETLDNDIIWYRFEKPLNVEQETIYIIIHQF